MWRSWLIFLFLASSYIMQHPAGRRCTSRVPRLLPGGITRSLPASVWLGLNASFQQNSVLPSSPPCFVFLDFRLASFPLRCLLASTDEEVQGRVRDQPCGLVTRLVTAVEGVGRNRRQVRHGRAAPGWPGPPAPSRYPPLLTFRCRCDDQFVWESVTAFEVRWAFLCVPDFIHSNFTYEIARGQTRGSHAD